VVVCSAAAPGGDSSVVLVVGRDVGVSDGTPPTGPTDLSDGTAKASGSGRGGGGGGGGGCGVGGDVGGGETDGAGAI
jgi:hypothetical protein